MGGTKKIVKKVKTKVGVEMKVGVKKMWVKKKGKDTSHKNESGVKKKVRDKKVGKDKGIPF